MMFFFINKDFPTLGSITYSQFDEWVQQHQREKDDCSEGLVLSGGSLKTDKESWYLILCGWICGRSEILTSKHLEKYIYHQRI